MIAYECNCHCHYSAGCVHCFPCCTTCEYCRANVTDLQAHIKEDHPHRYKEWKKEEDRLTKRQRRRK